MVYQRKHDYEYREGWRSNIEANVVGAVIEKIEAKNGEVTGQLFLDESRPEDSPTHKAFEWDDSKAAEKYRLHQAIKIIGAVRVVIRQEDVPKAPVKPQRAFVNISSDDSTRGRYINVVDAMSNEETRDIVLARAVRELKSFKEKYGDLAELSEVFAAISVVTERIEK